MLEKEKLRVVHDKNAENLFESKFCFRTKLTSFYMQSKYNSFIRYHDKELLENTCTLYFFPKKKKCFIILVVKSNISLLVNRNIMSYDQHFLN